MGIGVRRLAEYAANPGSNGKIKNSKAVQIGLDKHNNIGRTNTPPLFLYLFVVGLIGFAVFWWLK